MKNYLGLAFLILASGSVARAGFYSRAAALWAFDDAVELSKSSNYSASVDAAVGVSGAIGYQFAFLRLEGEANFINADIDDTGASDVTTSGDLDKTSLFVNALFEVPVPLIKPYVGGGVGVTHIKVDFKQLVSGSSPETAFSSNADDTTLAVQFMAGVRVSLLSTLTAYAGYRYYLADGLATTAGGYSLKTDGGVHCAELGIGLGF